MLLNCYVVGGAAAEQGFVSQFIVLITFKETQEYLLSSRQYFPESAETFLPFKGLYKAGRSHQSRFFARFYVLLYHE